MKQYKRLSIIALLCLFASSLGLAKPKKPVEVVMTVKVNGASKKVHIELTPDKAPKTVANFLAYVNDKFYDKTIFHRVINDFMIQGGGFTKDMKQKKTRPPVENEAKTGGSNARGTIAMARTPDPDSATTQFFINVKNNTNLDYSSRSPGYTVFGKVTKGMDVVDEISKVKTESHLKGMQDVPEKTVLIESIRLLKPKKPAASKKK